MSSVLNTPWTVSASARRSQRIDDPRRGDRLLGDGRHSVEEEALPRPLAPVDQYRVEAALVLLPVALEEEAQGPLDPTPRYRVHTRAMRIGEVASHAEVNVQTLRYYERRGLGAAQRSARARATASMTRRPSGRVRFIKRTQELGFTLNEIESLLELREGTGKCADVRAAAQAKIVDIEARIRGLEGMRCALQALVESCQNEGSERHCPLLEELEPEAE